MHLSRMRWMLPALSVFGLMACASCRPADNQTKTSKPAQTAAPAAAIRTADMPQTNDTTKVVKTESEWKGLLTPEQYHVLREKGTERAFTGKYWNTKDPGVYVCAGCGAELFRSDDKFDSGCGWPSFDKALADGRIDEHVDKTHGMVRIEITCARCGGHLGHVFDDGPTDTGIRYCVNSASVDLKPKSDVKDDLKAKPATPNTP